VFATRLLSHRARSPERQLLAARLLLVGFWLMEQRLNVSPQILNVHRRRSPLRRSNQSDDRDPLDRWSLSVIRDVMFGDRRHFGDLLRNSDEGIASNTLASRLARLVEVGLLSKTGDPTHKQKAIYSLTEPSIQLIALLAHKGAWGRRYTQASRELSVRAQLLEEGGERMWKAIVVELRSMHLGAPAQRNQP
jgi:DNA-binding HxlR family transcriptional regulator